MLWQMILRWAARPPCDCRGGRKAWSQVRSGPAKPRHPRLPRRQLGENATVSTHVRDASTITLRRNLAALLALLLIAAVPVSGGAQEPRTLRVVVQELESGRPITDAIISLIDRSNRRIHASLSNQAGLALLVAPDTGRYTVRAERIGYEASTSDTVVIAASQSSVTLRMTGRKTHLAAVNVSATRHCGSDPALGAQIAAVWNEVRKAITAAVLTTRELQDRHTAELVVRRYYRRLTPSLRVQRESSEVRRTRGESPFRSAPAQILSQRGYVQPLHEGIVFFAPDADVIVSDEFAEDHCFRVVRRREQDSVRIGLAFEPVSDRTLPDVAGAFWLDELSSELRYLEYRYSNLADSLAHTHVGGRVEFAQLNTGRWIVSRWHVRAPVLGRVGRAQIGLLDISARTELIGYHEEGGVVTGNTLSLSANSPARGSVVRGILYDSTGGQPLSGAHVTLLGVDAVVDTSASDGTFELTAPLAGEYTLSATHARGLLFGLGEFRKVVTLQPSETSWVHFHVPSESTLVRTRCSEVDPMEHRSLLVGFLVDSATGVKVPGATVSTFWATPELLKQGTVVRAGMRHRWIETTADQHGAFAICGVPRDTKVRIAAAGLGLEGEQVITIPEHGLTAQTEVRLAPAAEGGSVIGGVVTSNDGAQPIVGAEVELIGVGRPILTDTRGRFSIGRLAPGRYELVVRALGYSPFQHDISVGGPDSLHLTLVLSRSHTELAPVRIEGHAAQRGGLAGFEHRRALHAGGRFITREQLQPEHHRRLSDALRTMTTGVDFVRLARGGVAAATGRGRSGISSAASAMCFVQIFVDGARIFSPTMAGPSVPPPNLDDFSVQDIAAVEVYAGPAQTPPEYGGVDAACGTILLWLRNHG